MNSVRERVLREIVARLASAIAPTPVLRMPAVVPVKWFPTRVENDEIQVGLDD